MAKKDSPLSKNDSLLIEGETKTLAEELAFYARGPVRIKLTGGDHIAYTYGCDDKLHAINIVMNPSILTKVRNKERAVAIWRGIGFHELAHHLWPAEAQYETAVDEGFKSLFNLLDDEQNERRGRAMNAAWGACFQTVCAYIFPSKKHKSSGKISTGIIDGEEEEEAEGIEALDAYSIRWNEFAFHFRRHEPGAEDREVIEALSMIPRNFKDLSKSELLDLTRNIHKVLSRGILAPPRPPKMQPEPPEEKPEEPPPPPVMPTRTSNGWGLAWLPILTSKWSYAILSLFVLGYCAMFLDGRFQFWLEAFYALLLIVVCVGIYIGITRFLRWLAQRALESAKFRLVVRKRRTSPWDKVKSVFRWIKKQAQKAARWFFSENNLLWKPRIMRWLLYNLLAGWRLLTIGFFFALSRIRDGWLWLRYQVQRTVRMLWRKQVFRIALVSIPLAMLLAMSISFLEAASKISWWMFVLALLVLLAMLILGWIFRKKILDFLIAELRTDANFKFECDLDFPIDKETLTFNILDHIVAVEADAEFLKQALPEAVPIAQQLRPHMEKCGTVFQDIEFQDDGYDLVDELEQAWAGETSLCVDEEPKSRASMHIEVALDCSTSMLSPTETLTEGQKFRLGKCFALIVEESVRSIRGISSHFYGFTDTAIFDCGEAGQGRISGLQCQGGNNDSAMFWHMAQSAAKSGKELKILIMISDGQPSDCSWGSLHNLIEQAEADGMIPIQIAVDKIREPAFKRLFIDLVGQTMTEAVITMGHTLASLVESGV